MIRHALLSLAIALLLSSCNRAPENKDAVQAGLLEHLSKNTGLDLNSMNVDITNVRFQGTEAFATVAFRPKQSPETGMTMNYTLERKGDKWQVKGKPESSGSSHAAPAAPQGGMPPDHPPVTAPEGKSSELPAGHPPVSAPEPAKK